MDVESNTETKQINDGSKSAVQIKTITQSIVRVLYQQFKHIMKQENPNINFNHVKTKSELDRRVLLVKSMIEYISIQVHQIKSLSFALASTYLVKCLEDSFNRRICDIVGTEKFWRWCIMLVSVDQDSANENGEAKSQSTIVRKNYFRPTAEIKKQCEALPKSEQEEFMNNQKKLKQEENKTNDMFADDLSNDWKQLKQLIHPSIILPDRSSLSFILTYQEQMLKVNFFNMYEMYTEKRQGKVVRQQVVETVARLKFPKLNKCDLTRTTSWMKSEINNIKWHWQSTKLERVETTVPNESKNKWLARMKPILDELDTTYISQHRQYLPEDHNLTKTRWRRSNMSSLIYYTRYIWSEYKRFEWRMFSLVPNPKMQMGFINININGIFNMYRLSYTNGWNKWFKQRSENSSIWKHIPFNCRMDWIIQPNDVDESNSTINYTPGTIDWFLENKSLIYSRMVDMNRVLFGHVHTNKNTTTNDELSLSAAEATQYKWVCTNNLLSDGQQLKLVWEKRPLGYVKSESSSLSFAERKCEQKQQSNSKKKQQKDNKAKVPVEILDINHLSNKLYTDERSFQGCLKQRIGPVTSSPISQEVLQKTIISVDLGRVTIIQAVRQEPASQQEKQITTNIDEVKHCCAHNNNDDSAIRNGAQHLDTTTTNNKKRKSENADSGTNQQYSKKIKKTKRVKKRKRKSRKHNTVRKQKRKMAREDREREANVSTYSLSNKQYYMMCGFKSTQKKEQAHRQKSGVSELDFLLSKVTYKTCLWSELESYFRVIFDPGVWNDYWNYAQKPIVRKWKFQRFQTQQSAFQTIARQLVGLPVKKDPIKDKKRFESCVVIMGDGGFGSSGKGHDSAPNKKLRIGLSQFVPIIMVGERNTSKLTACCHWESFHPKHNQHNTAFLPPKKKFNYWLPPRWAAKVGKAEVRNVLYCRHPKLTDCQHGLSTPHISGSRPWKRDVNGAVAILHRFLTWISQGVESDWSKG